MGKFSFMLLSAVMTGVLLLSAVPVFAQDAEWVYRQQMEKARADRQNGKYKEAATAATRAFLLADELDNVRRARDLAIELSISANAAARNSGVPFRGPWSVLILKEEGMLLLLEKGTICRRFPLSLGKEFSVPAGDFKVGAKLGYPNYELNGTLYKVGAVGNTLGSRWIELKNAEGTPVSGICGESMLKPEQAEKPLFFCLKNADINEIFGLLAEGCEVKVK